MKKIIMLLAVMTVNFVLEAQVKTPAPSPKATVSQTVGLTEVEIEYSRPSAKGRVIFGDLVPFGKMWRAGANQNSTVSFSEDVVIAGTTVKKGKYAIFITPKADNWEVVFYTDTNNSGLPAKWDDTKVAVKANVKPEILNRNVETLNIAVNGLDNDFGFIEFSWEKTLAALKFEVPTQKATLANIEKVLAGPSFGDYFSSAQYFYQSNADANKALTFVNKAIELKGGEAPFWYNRLKSQIQAKLGDKKGAIETAKISMVDAEKASNADYVKMNKESIAEWSKK